MNDDATGQTLRNLATGTGTPPTVPPITPPPGETEHPVPGFEITKTNLPGDTVDVAAGGTVFYTVVGKNTGATVLDPVVITDDLSGVLANADLDEASLTATLSDGTAAPAPVFSAADQKITWTGTLPVGVSVTLTYQVAVHDDADENAVTLKNTVTGTATPPNGPDLTPPPVATENPVPGYTFAKTSDPASLSSVQGGDAITYTLTGVNTGATALDPVTIDDDLAQVLAFAEIDESSIAAFVNGVERTDLAPSLDGTMLSWVGSLAVGETVEVRYTVTVKDGMAGATIENRATSTATPPTVPPITPPPGETEHPVPGFALSKTNDPGDGVDVEAGGTVTYTVVGANTGATVLDPVRIVDDLSGVLANADLDEASVSLVMSDGSVALMPVFDKDAQTLTWAGTLPVGATVTMTYTVTVHDDADENAVTLKNTVTGTATPPNGPELTPPPVTTENPVPGFTFAKVSDPATGQAVQPGDTITYTLTGVNTGATTLDPVTVTDDLSEVLAHATLVEDSLTASTGDAPTLDGTTLTWTGALTSGQTITITYQVTVNDDATGVVLHNLATATATPPTVPPITPPPGETIHPTPGFSLVKTSDPVTGSQVFAGQSITYTLTASNLGETVLDLVVVTDDLSGVLGLADLDTSSIRAEIDGESAAAPVVDGETLTWTGSLERGQVATVSYTVTVKDVAASKDNVIRNHATATATPPGLPPLTPPAVETEHPIPALTLVKSSDPATGTRVAIGDVVSYDVTAANTGATALRPVTVFDDLSGVLGAASLTTQPTATITAADGTERDAGTVTFENEMLTWQGDLAIGERVSIRYAVTVENADSTLRNVATATYPGEHPETPPSTTEHTPDPEPTPEPTPVPSDSTPPAIAVTGTNMPTLIIAFGVLVLTAGGLLLASRRRTTAE